MDEKKPLLLIMRHAKTKGPLLFKSDFERTLDQRGHHQPQVIATKINLLNITIDAAIISPSFRTTQTWSLLQQGLLNPPPPVFDPRLYNASLQAMIEVTHEQAHLKNCLLIVAHCPAVIEVVEFLTGQYHDFKTANLAILSATTKKLEDAVLKPHQFSFIKMITADD